MATIKEDYVSFETAKLLKEKGFDEDIDLWYDKNGEMFFRHKYDISSDWRVRQGLKIYQCPSLQMAMKWLREVHGLFVSICNDDLDYNWQIFDVKNRTKDLDPTCLTNSYAGYRNYELAAEAAIKHCLENLI